jgi:hypothetical protein
MIITLSPGDVFSDVLSNFRPANHLTITFNTEWDWGHTCQIDFEHVDHYDQGHTLHFSQLPHLNIAHAGLTGIMELEIKRL